MADQHLSRVGLRCEVPPVLVLVRQERELVATLVWAGRDSGLLRAQRGAPSTWPAPDPQHRGRRGAMGRGVANVAVDDLDRRGAHLRLRGVGSRALHTADDAHAAGGGALWRRARAHGPLGPLAGSDGQERRGTGHGFDCGTTGAGGRQGRQEGLLHSTLTHLDLPEARPGVHRKREVGLCARPVREEDPPNPDVATQRVQHLGDRTRQ